MKTLILGALMMAFGLSISSCDSVEAAFDCHDVCNRYKDCFDASYDVDGCESRCRADAANNPNKKAQADQCDACIGNMSCLSTAFNCSSDCSGIVPN